MSPEQELSAWLTDFLEGRFTVEQLQWRLEKFIKEGHRSTLSLKHRKIIGEFFDWYVDMYDSRLLPRPGIVGHLRDTWAQIIRGEYRVSLQDVRRKAQEVQASLNQGHSDDRIRTR